VTSGSLLRRCRGEVLKVLSHYAWIMVYGNIDDSSVDEHGREAYIPKNDVVDDTPLSAGDIVSFNLHHDDQGLRAEDCQVLQKAAAPCNAAKDVAFDVECRQCVIGCADVFSRLSSVFSSIDGDDDHDEGDHALWNVTPVSLVAGSKRGPAATDVDRIADVFTRSSNVCSSDGQAQDEDDLEPKCTPPDSSTSEGSDSDVDRVAGVFMHLSKAFSSDGEDDADDELNLGSPYNAEAQEQVKSDIIGLAGVFMRLSRAFSSEGGDGSDADDEFDLGSPCKAEATTAADGSALGNADMDIEHVADVFLRLSSAFSSYDEDDCDADDDFDLGSPVVTLNRTKTMVMRKTKAAPAVNADHVAGVFMHLSKAFSLHDADHSDADDELDLGGRWKAGATPAVACSTSEKSTDRIADVFMRLSEAIDSDDDDEADNEFDLGSPWKTKATPAVNGSMPGNSSSDIDDVAHVFMRLSRVVSLHDEDDADADDEFDLGCPWKGVSAPEVDGSDSEKTARDMDHVAGVFMCLHNAFSSDEEGEDEEECNLWLDSFHWKAKRTPSSDGSTRGGATSDSEQDISFYEASDSEIETYAEVLAQ